MSEEVKITQETHYFVETIVNGRSTGKKQVNGVAKDFLTKLAQENGIRTFTGTIDGVPVTNDTANQPIPEGSTVGVQAKDARGAKKKAAEPAPEPPAAPPAAEPSTEGGQAQDYVDEPATEGGVEGGAA